MSISYERTDEYFDLHVPGPEHYLAEGVWHHNTGKTLANCLRVYWVCRKYPGARCLVVRKTRESLTESVLVTWERLLGPGHPVLARRPILRRVRQSYLFPNGSEVVVAGIDKPGKILSSEYDLVYVPEATDLTVEDWETLSGRLRAGRVPYDQMIADCNPSTPHHWLYKRCVSGACKLVPTTHQDNPRFWDRAAADWTPDGRRYMARLERNTGTRRDRFLLGRWVAAEGCVYAYDPDVHLLPADWAAPREWRRVWAVDWGERAPTVLQVWAADPEGRLYLTREVFRCRLRADELGRWARREVDEGREPPPYATVCDHDDDKRRAFERESGVPADMADKADRDRGIQAMQARFDAADDGRPRIFFREGARDHPADPTLAEEGRPASTAEELVGYCFVTGTRVRTAAGEVPIERVRIGDLVYTRAGLRRVIEAGRTQSFARVMSVTFTNGATLTGTPEHPVFVVDKGWTPLHVLMPNDIVEAWTQSALHSTALFTHVTPIPRGIRTGCISGPHRHSARGGTPGCTSMYGGFPSERSPRDATSITRTAITSTTISTTSSALVMPSTSTPTAATPFADPPSGWRNWNGHGKSPARKGRLPNSGRRRRNGVASGGDTKRPPTEPVFGVEPFSNLVILPKSGSVIQSVTRHGDTPRRRITKTEPACTAGTSSESRSGRVQSAAPVRVVSCSEEEARVPVYNLTVEGQPEYYANGILVHNCWDPKFLKDEPVAENDHGMDAARYAVRYADANLGPGCGGSVTGEYAPRDPPRWAR